MPTGKPACLSRQGMTSALDVKGDEMKEILLSRGEKTIVDDADFAYLSQWKWSLFKWSKSNTYYAGRRCDRKIIYMHIQLMNYPQNITVDHNDGNGLNDQRSNLRLATQSQQKMNTTKNSRNTSGFKGVCWDKTHNKWRVRIGVNGKKINVGRFDNPIDAARAYDEAAIKYFGEFAKLNLPRLSSTTV